MEKDKKCCCGNDNNNEKEKQVKIANQKISLKGVQVKKVSCNDSVMNEENNHKHDCCSTKEEHKHDCCSTKEEHKHDCCGTKEDHKHKHSGDCCHHKHESEGASCCGSSNHKHDANCGCGIENNSSTKSNIIKLAISFVALVISFIWSGDLMEVSPFFHYVNVGWIALILCGYPIVMGAFNGLKKKKITSSLLITVAMLGSVVLEILVLVGVTEGAGDGHSHSYIFAAGEIAFLMMIGELIEDFTVRKSRAGIQKLINLSPTTAFVEVNGELQERDVKNVNIGDIVVVRPGDIVPIDGKVVFGETSIDESNMTGESVPVDKKVGDNVFGGTTNASGMIKVEATTLAQDMSINKLIQMVEEAEGKKAPIARLADKWAGYIVPAAIMLSFVVAVIAMLFKVPVIDSIIRGITVLVVFCPCALALATPTAVAAGLGAATKYGMLIKSGAALEELSKVDTICFDKTGTITQCKLEVVDIESDDKDKMMSYFMAIEKYSEHPLAKAIYDYCKANNYAVIEVSNPTAIVGSGVKADIEGGTIQAIKYASSINYKDSEKYSEMAQAMLNSGKTVIALIENDRVLGIISLSDTIKKDAKEGIAQLNSIGINTILLTGDNEFSAKKVASDVEIQEVHAGLLPQDKLNHIERLKTQGHTVCMIGDGVNDAPSLATANCSMAYAKLGSDIVAETADIALLNDNVDRTVIAVRLSRKVMKVIKANIILSIIINICSVILSGLGILNPVTGALVHNLSSIFVVTNSALLLARKFNKQKESKNTAN